MPLTFPSSPINGAVAGEYTYDAVKGAWRKNGAYPVSVTHSDVAPSNPRVGDQWWKSNEGTLFTYYNDGTSSQWVESTNVVANVEPNPIPAGAMMAWGSSTAPANWLLCDGTAINRSTYASLFAVIGTTYGSGDGTTTFNLPDLRGRVPVGQNSATSLGTATISIATPGVVTRSAHGLSDGQIVYLTTTGALPTGLTASTRYFVRDATTTTFTLATTKGGSAIATSGTQSGTHTLYSADFADLARTNGEINHTLTTAEMPVHNHSLSFSGQTFTNAGAGGYVASANGAAGQGGPTGQWSYSINNTGGGVTHYNLQPYIVLNYIIKFSAGETPGDSELAVRVGAVEAANNAIPLSQNYIINGGFDIWQRGTSIATGGGGTTNYGADRWRFGNNNAGSQYTMSRVANTSPAPTAYALRLTSSRVDVSLNGLEQVFEYLDVMRFSGKTLTLSFWVRASTAISFTSSIQTGTLTTDVYAGTGNALTGQISVGSKSISATTSWQRVSLTTSVISSSAGQLRVSLMEAISITSGVWVEFAGVQLEDGLYATPFRRNAPSIQAELAACQRYYIRWQNPSGGTEPGVGAWVTDTSAQISLFMPCSMRAKASSVEFSASSITRPGVNAFAISSVVLSRGDTNTQMVIATSSSSGASIGSVAKIETNNSSGFIALSAEI